MSLESVVKREIRRIYKEPLFWTVAFIMPLAMCLIICLIFSKGSPTDMPIAVLNDDNSAFSRMFVRDLEALPSCSVKYNVTSLEEGRQLLTEGKAYAFVAIPRDFQRDIYRLKQPKLLFYYNNQRILIGGIISKDVTMLVQTMMVGLDATIRSKRGLPMDEAIKQANLIRVNEHVRSNPYFNYQYFLSIVAFGPILQIHLILTMLWALGTEFKYGTTKEWLKSADGSIIKAYFGKLIPYFAVFLMLFAILFGTYFMIMGIPYTGDWFMGILSTLLFIFTCCCVSIIFISINGNFRYGLSNAAFYVAMGFAFAGVTYPVMVMPWIAKAYSATLPLSYWVQVMIDQSLRQIPIIYDFKHINSMLILSAVGLLALIRLKKLAMDEKRWYQS